MKTIKIAITVDDLPYHGSCISEEEKYADVINFLDILNNKKIAGIYGFINGKSIEEPVLLHLLLNSRSVSIEYLNKYLLDRK